jgi:small-conductance mechanosensitive channel
MKIKHFIRSKIISLAIWGPIGVLALVGRLLFPDWVTLKSGVTLLQLVAYLAAIMVGSELISLAIYGLFKRQRKPPVEGVMLGNLLRLVAVFGVIIIIAYGFGQLSAFGQFFTLFGGMLLGWTLQAPVSGFAAWALVSLKRPFRPGDRIQFPNLGLVGDVKDIGLMYTMLDQVGGSIGSEEAVGRYILVPNAMLFSQVAINYTVVQEAAYMLDEVVIRITYDSDWELSEKILVDAAVEVTADIVKTSGVKPYVRSDWYDYGVYLRLRYQTHVKDRVEIAYRIQKKIFLDIQKAPNVDMAIPFIYSNRAGMDRKDEGTANAREREKPNPYQIHEIAIAQIEADIPPSDEQAVRELMDKISKMGLLQPIVILPNPATNKYEVMAGHLRLEACKRLGWKTVPAVVKGKRAEDAWR